MAWEEAPQNTGGQWAKFPNQGDAYEGEVVEIDLYAGSKTFDGDVCGYVQLKQEGGAQIRIGLDKRIIADQVAAVQPSVGDRLRVEFVGWETSQATGRQYKNYKVWIDRAHPQPANGHAVAAAAPQPAPAPQPEPPPVEPEPVAAPHPQSSGDDDLPF